MKHPAGGGPLVSILTPAYNAAATIGACLASVRGQRDPLIEHIVADGGSDDGTVDILARTVGLRWSSERDSGQWEALRSAFLSSNGEWIAWLNADEILLPGTMARWRRAVEASSADVVYGDMLLMDATFRLTGALASRPFSRRALSGYGCYIFSCTTFVRRKAIASALWSNEFKTCLDWDVWLRMAANGRRFLYLPEPVAAFMVHDGQLTQTHRDLGKAEAHQLRRRYRSVPVPRAIAVGGHRLRKLTSGAAGRQRRYERSLQRGLDLRWWELASARKALDELR